MTYQFPHLIAQAAKDETNARTLAKLLIAWADNLAAFQAHPTNRTEDIASMAELRVCTAAVDLMDDGDFLARQQDLMSDLRVDEDGKPYVDDEPASSADVAEYMAFLRSAAA